MAISCSSQCPRLVCVMLPTTCTIVVNNKTIATENADRITGWRLPKTIIQQLFSP